MSRCAVGKSDNGCESAVFKNNVLCGDGLIVEICTILAGSKSVRSLGSAESCAGSEGDNLVGNSKLTLSCAESTVGVFTLATSSTLICASISASALAFLGGGVSNLFGSVITVYALGPVIIVVVLSLFAMSVSGNFLLSNLVVASRTMRALGKTGFGTCGILCHVGDHIVIESRNLFLSLNSLATYGALLTLGKSCLGTGCSLCGKNLLGVTLCSKLGGLGLSANLTYLGLGAGVSTIGIYCGYFVVMIIINIYMIAVAPKHRIAYAISKTGLDIGSLIAVA